ncbi:hypothetical protein Trydic_g8365 [Trypoxylus dichotomus]
MEASGKSKESDEIKIALLMNFLGDEGIRIYNTLELNEGEDGNKLSEILSIRDSRIQEKLLQYPNLSLSEAVNINRSMETSMATQKEIAREPILVSSGKKHIQKSGFNASRNIPVLVRKFLLLFGEKFKSKLEQMVAEKIIEPITEPTDWVHPIVVVPIPNDDIRICMDPRSLNKYIKRELYHIPTQDTLFSQLAGAKYFSLLDASSAFLQIPLTYESLVLCTFVTSYSAPEIFQRLMHEILEGFDGVISYFDGILVFGQALDEHNRNLDVTLSKIRASGLTLNLDKSQFCVTKLKFLGHTISDQGISIDNNKAKAIRDMNPRKNEKDLQRFLETSVLRGLLSNKSEWQWTEVYERCFNRLKEFVLSTTTLSYYDSTKETTLSVDASPYGLGAVLTQDGRPIEFAFVSLTPSQQRYNHIEKELLAAVFGCELFDYYLFDRSFSLQTDHRPLIGLLKKPLDELSPRIQRLALRLLGYEFILSYVPEKNLQVPDTLSREPSKDIIDTEFLETNLRVYSVIETSQQNAQASSSH